MAEFITRATIRATPDAVWKILTDAAGYAAWNPEIVAIEGRLAAGERIKARVKIGNGAIRTVALRVTAFEAPGRMQWTAGLPLGLFSGVRTLTVAPCREGAEFQMLVQMTGPLGGLMVKAVGDRQSAIDGFSAGLKARAESTA